ncbi:MAG: STAS domain-containing protein [Ferruginibacter sp.]
MNVKLDTKEKFTVLTPNEHDIPANMTAELNDLLFPYLEKDPPHIILNLKQVINISEEAIDTIAGLQQQFYDRNASFIVCELQNNVEILIEEKHLLATMNITPTESEAWDIVQMEQIEREIMGGDWGN